MIVWPAGVVDYLSNAFTPDRAAVWDGAIEAAGVQVKVQHDPTDGFADPDTMVARMSSISWIAVLPDAERIPLLDRVRAVFDGMPPRFPVPYHTELWWCRAR